MRRLFFIAGVLVALGSVARAQNSTTLSVLDLGTTPFAQKSGEKLRERLRSTVEILVADADLTRAAAKGIGYSGSLNLSVGEARDLGAALATDYYLLGDAQTLRRSSSAKPEYYESYCSLFLVSARTGRLVMWDRPSVQKDQAAEAENGLSSTLLGAETIHRIVIAIRRAREDERVQRNLIATRDEPVIEDAPDDEKLALAQGLSLPRPYRRLRPDYPESAARAEAEATVDVLVDVRADGEIGEVQIARWAGFGLDETTVATVRQMHFFPAMKNGSPIPMRVLLRYNFRKPPR
jgi:TonB family protein